MKKYQLIILLITVATLVFAEGKPQTVCPIMGGKINKTQYADVEGYRIYTCCPGCIGKIKADSDKYIKQLESEGIELESSPAKKEASDPKGGCGHCG